ncbi:MAG: sigma 54-interacting transcriptional regulator [Calditrichota bacterium]
MDPTSLREQVLRSLVRFYAYEILQRRDPGLSELFPYHFAVWTPPNPATPPPAGRHRVHILCDLLFRHFSTAGEESPPPTSEEIDRLWGESFGLKGGAKFLSDRLDSSLFDLWGFNNRENPDLEEAILKEFPGQSEGRRRMLVFILQASQSGLPVLITGPEGSEKERIACFIHSHSERSNRPLFALSAELLSQDRSLNHPIHDWNRYKVEALSTGSWVDSMLGGAILVLDINKLPPVAQMRLVSLAVSLEEKVMQGEISSSVFRLISTSAHDLQSDVENGTFRRDLYYRAAVIQIEVPSLNDRPEDIPEMINNLLEHHRALNSSLPVQSFSDDALERLQKHTWQRDIEEFNAVMDRALVLCQGSQVQVEHLIFS